MTWNRVKQEWKKLALMTIRPSVVLSAFAWLVLEVAGSATSNPVLRIPLLALAAVSAVISGKNLKY
ncbi:MAG: hypothetical protein WC477_04655 [Patescibacteria group bacterium]